MSSLRRAHLAVDERMARGRAARAQAPRSAHARWEPAPDRPDPVALLEAQAVSRVAELVPIRYGRMLVSPFTFYRGAAQASVLEPYAGRSAYPHHGQRAVMGQWLMQAAGDIFLGWQRIKGLDDVTRDYYVRQFHDWKGGADVENMLVPGATVYARICGATLARAHARCGDHIAIASYLGQSDSPPPTPTRTSVTTRRSPRP